LQIKIISVEVEKINKGKTGYSQAEVLYENEKGEKKSWKVVSFTNPAVFATISNAQSGDVYNIVTGKNDRDYTVWTAAEKADGTSSKGSAKSSGTYEEKDAARQRLIVRQSCLAQAVAARKADDTEEEVLGRAERFVDWVFETPDLFDQPNEI